MAELLDTCQDAIIPAQLQIMLVTAYRKGRRPITVYDVGSTPRTSTKHRMDRWPSGRWRQTFNLEWRHQRGFESHPILQEQTMGHVYG